MEIRNIHEFFMPYQNDDPKIRPHRPLYSIFQVCDPILFPPPTDVVSLYQQLKTGAFHFKTIYKTKNQSVYSLLRFCQIRTRLCFSYSLLYQW